MFQMVKQLQLKIKLVLIILFFISQNIFSQKFEPKEVYFEGYIHEYFNGHTWFNVLLQSKNQNIDFKFDTTNNKVYFTDSSIVILFWGSIYHNIDTQMNKLYHKVLWHDFYKTIPEFKYKKKYYNKTDSLVYYHRISKGKVKLLAFDYQEYLPYKNEYGELSTYGIYSKDNLYPEMISSKNDFFIVNYFIQ